MTLGEVLFDDVSKTFRLKGRKGRHETVKGALFSKGRRRPASQPAEFRALEGINVVVSPGEVVALLGPNGSGKSTFLKMAGGILRPTAGRVTTEGRITALIELGAGFHPEITGWENVVINGMLLGLSRREVEQKMDDILEFAGIGDFIDRPVKTYSSGMYVRLGFAVAVAVDPDILLIDEVLAVGDEAFVARCLDRLAHMRRRGVTMILVTHDLDLAVAFADRAIYLDHGRVVADGPTDQVVARYRGDVAGERVEPERPRNPVRVLEEGRRWGTVMSRSSMSKCVPTDVVFDSCRVEGPPRSESVTACTDRLRIWFSVSHGMGKTEPWSVAITPTSTVFLRNAR